MIERREAGQGTRGRRERENKRQRGGEGVGPYCVIVDSLRFHDEIILYGYPRISNTKMKDNK